MNSSVSLYHYSKPEVTWMQRTIVHNEIYFLSREQLNDPFDLRNKITIDDLNVSSEKHIKAFFGICELFANAVSEWPEEVQKWQDMAKNGPSDAHVKKRFVDEIDAGIEDIAKTNGIFCLTDDPASIPMWSHYADGHKGVAYRFNVEGVRGEERCVKMTYKDGFLKFKDIADVFRGANDDAGKFARNLFKLAYAWKAESWESEKEWRLFSKIAIKSYLKIPLGSMELTGIILGMKMKREMRVKVMRLIRESRRQIQIFDAKPCKGSIGLQLVPVDNGNGRCSF